MVPPVAQGAAMHRLFLDHLGPQRLPVSAVGLGCMSLGLADVYSSSGGHRSIGNPYTPRSRTLLSPKRAMTSSSPPRAST